jgi:hypothetical protein
VEEQEESIHSPIDAIFGLNFGDINVPSACNVAMASMLTSGGDCPGYFLQITAKKPFGHKVWAFHHDGKNLVVRPGIDNKTYLNLLTFYRSLPSGVLPGSYAE